MTAVPRVRNHLHARRAAPIKEMQAIRTFTVMRDREEPIRPLNGDHFSGQPVVPAWRHGRDPIRWVGTEKFKDGVAS